MAQLDQDEYLVRWEMVIGEAESPADAALRARDIQFDPSSVATVFTVEDSHGNVVEIDLEEEGDQ